MKRMKKIIEFLGRKPRNDDEYAVAYRFLFRRKHTSDIVQMQKRRHRQHTGPASSARRFCIYCQTK